jgi:hypothetical protein
VAAVLAWHISRDAIHERGPAAVIAENPLLDTMRPREEVEAALMLSRYRLTLGLLDLRAAEQLTELLLRYGAREGIVVAERMDDLDQRRYALLRFAMSMASPLRLGPPDALIPELLEQMDMDGAS